MTGEPIAAAEPTASEQPASVYKPLRFWPVLLFLAGMLIMPQLPTLLEDGPAMIWMAAALGPTVFAVLILLWWLTFSRATGRERLVGFLGIVVSLGATVFLLHKSMQGPGMLMVTIPTGFGLFGLFAMLCARMLNFKRTVIATAVAALGFLFSTLLQTEGVWGNFSPQLSWRWTETAEDRLLANAVPTENVAIEDVATQLENPEWPGFRGTNRDSRVTGVRYSADWKTQPPELLWKIPIGPGWSSFAVAGNLLFTQEQRGPNACVVCYDADSGKQVWAYELESRFEEAMAGPGPRATPTLADSQLYTTMAEGFLLRIDPKTGELVWKTNLREASGASLPMWGFSSSPLVIDSVVIVHAGGDGDKGVLGFNIEDGELVWSAPCGSQSYSSPQLAQIDGEQFVLLASDTGVTVIDPKSGSARLDYAWPHPGYRSLQPQMLDTNTMLIPTGEGTGLRRLTLSNVDGELKTEDKWTTRHLKSDYNDMVVHNGFGYGFDNVIFACVDLETGKRKWKRGRYGKGQVVLLADSGLLLVAGEKGDAILLEANPEKHVELGKFKAIKGKTWNHPVVVGDRLYIRNGEEAACFRLPLADAS